MRQVTFQPTFEEWQKIARNLLGDSIAPEAVLWVEKSGDQPSLDLFAPFSQPQVASASQFKVPARFMEVAKRAALHSDEGKWALLYRVLWRLTHGEPHLFEAPADADFLAITHLEKQVQKDAYRMRAFLRFRETHLNGEPWFVAWYEPEHDVIHLNEDFFAGRYTSMRWSILTPRRCMHWDGSAISFSPGVSVASAPASDDLEPLWITYYSNIFNPARIKPAAMQAQLLKRNWKNLPEAVVIEPLLRAASARTTSMLDKSEFLQVRDGDYSLAQPPPGADLNALRAAAASCKACPLWKTATCTVFGEGPSEAQIVLFGEQPGDQEDRIGRPFVGPAGQVLNRALEEAGVDRNATYVTNAVKHFKFEPRGKRRMHKNPGAREIAACRPWLEAEMTALQPRLLVALGATAARSIFNEPVRITENRSRVLESQFGPVLVTIHPSALLRLPPSTSFEPEFERFVSDLRQIQSP